MKPDESSDDDAWTSDEMCLEELEQQVQQFQAENDERLEKQRQAKRLRAPPQDQDLRDILDRLYQDDERLRTEQRDKEEEPPMLHNSVSQMPETQQVPQGPQALQGTGAVAATDAEMDWLAAQIVDNVITNEVAPPRQHFQGQHHAQATPHGDPVLMQLQIDALRGDVARFKMQQYQQQKQQQQLQQQQAHGAAYPTASLHSHQSIHTQSVPRNYTQPAAMQQPAHFQVPPQTNQHNQHYQAQSLGLTQKHSILAQHSNQAQPMYVMPQSNVAMYPQSAMPHPPHTQQPNNTASNPRPAATWPCEGCDETFATKSGFIAHMEREHLSGVRRDHQLRRDRKYLKHAVDAMKYECRHDKRVKREQRDLYMRAISMYAGHFDYDPEKTIEEIIKRLCDRYYRYDEDMKIRLYELAANSLCHLTTAEMWERY